MWVPGVFILILELGKDVLLFDWKMFGSSLLFFILIGDHLDPVFIFTVNVFLSLYFLVQTKERSDITETMKICLK